jgi:DNA-binding transcriptional regulator/RsmH inhibitor MraZ
VPVDCFPEDEFKSLLDRMKERIPKSDRKGQKWIAMFTESTVDRQMDKANRISLHSISLLEYARITGKVKIYGHDDAWKSGQQKDGWKRWSRTLTNCLLNLAKSMISDMDESLHIPCY